MFGLTTKKERNSLIAELLKVTMGKATAELQVDTLERRIKYHKSKEFELRTEISNLEEKLKTSLKTIESKELRKKELEQYFTEARANGLNPRQHLEVSWKEYQSLFQKESCETKESLLKFHKKYSKQEFLLKSVKEILDWYKSEELQFTPESKQNIKDMLLNLEIAYKNMKNSDIGNKYRLIKTYKNFSELGVLFRKCKDLDKIFYMGNANPNKSLHLTVVSVEEIENNPEFWEKFDSEEIIKEI